MFLLGLCEILFQRGFCREYLHTHTHNNLTAASSKKHWLVFGDARVINFKVFVSIPLVGCCDICFMFLCTAAVFPNYWRVLCTLDVDRHEIFASTKCPAKKKYWYFSDWWWARVHSWYVSISSVLLCMTVLTRSQHILTHKQL